MWYYDICNICYIQYRSIYPYYIYIYIRDMLYTRYILYNTRTRIQYTVCTVPEIVNVIEKSLNKKWTLKETK